MDNVTSISFAPGLGTVGFNEDNSAFGTLRVDGEPITIKGHFSGAGAELSGGDFRLVLQPILNRVANGPALRGSLLNESTGEIRRVVAWAPKSDGAMAYGLSFESRGAGKAAMVLPF